MSSRPNHRPALVPILIARSALATPCLGGRLHRPRRLPGMAPAVGLHPSPRVDCLGRTDSDLATNLLPLRGGELGANPFGSASDGWARLHRALLRGGRLYPASWARRIEILIVTLVLGSWFGFAVR